MGHRDSVSHIKAVFNYRKKTIKDANGNELVNKTIENTNLQKAREDILKETESSLKIIINALKNKGFNDKFLDDIEKSWKSHVQSLKDVVKSIKNGNN